MNRSMLVLVAVAVGVVIADVVTKTLATAALADGPVELAGPLALRLGENPGVAFGVGAGAPGWLIVGGVTAATGVLAVAAVRGVLPPLPAGLVLGGALGNLVDRVGDGAVTDFVDLGWWPVFNLADAALTCGVVGLILASLFAAPPNPHTRETQP